MKKILSAIIALYLIAPAAKAQDDEIRPKAIGVSFFVNDFITPDRIRTTSLSQASDSEERNHPGRLQYQYGVSAL